MTGNRSAAVMQQRTEDKDSLDYFPTPPWATRALMEHVIPEAKQMTLWEPAAGEGWMAEVLKEYSKSVLVSDIKDYGYPCDSIGDFLEVEDEKVCDWVITNPPFNKALEFIQKSQKVSRVGCAMLVRSAFLESKSRYEKLFKDNPPTIYAPFVERVSMTKHKMDHTVSGASAHAWLVWKWEDKNPCTVLWIPPCKDKLLLDADKARESEWNRWTDE